MPHYRRNRAPGGTYFFTVNLLDRRSTVLTDNIGVLRTAVAGAMAHRPFHIDAWVVLPDHMHAIWTLPDGDADYSGRWRAIKKAFAKALPATERRSDTRVRRGERGVWQRRFWEHTISEEADYAAHMDYTHFNPVKHRLVENAGDWPFSSFVRCVRQGLYPADWAGGGGQVSEAGERG